MEGRIRRPPPSAAAVGGRGRPLLLRLLLIVGALLQALPSVRSNSSGSAGRASRFSFLPLRPQAGGSADHDQPHQHQPQQQQPQQQQPPPEQGGTAGLSPEVLAWEKVEWLAAQVADAAASPYPGRGVSVARKGKGYQLHGSEYKANATTLDLSAHDQIVRVDPERRVIHVEPSVTMEKLVRAALAYGMVPKVVAPFRHATVGGAIMASSASSASHRHGSFHDCCSYLTVVLGNGTIATCSKHDRPELFHSLGGSHGALGIVALAGIECEPAGEFVRLAYSRQRNVEEGAEGLRRACGYYTGTGTGTGTGGDGQAPTPCPDFVDAVVFHPQAAQRQQQRAQRRVFGRDQEPYPHQHHAEASQLSVHAWHELEPPQFQQGVPETEAAEEEPPLPLYSGSRPFDLFYSEHLQDIHALLLTAEAEQQADAIAAQAQAQAAQEQQGGAPLSPPPPLPPLAPCYYAERMRTEDYLFRYDRGAFWLAQPTQASSGSSGAPLLQRLSSGWLYPLASRFPVARLLSRWLFSSSASLFLLLRQATPDLLASRLLVARPSLPLDRVPSLLAFLHGTVPLAGTPLLHLNPVKGAGVRQPFSPQGHIDALFVEVGVYGRVADGRGREHARRLEHFVAAQEGRKALCGQNFYEPSALDFWRGFPLYSLDEYRYLREKYGAEGRFPDLPAKVCEPLLEGARQQQQGQGSGVAVLLRRYLDSRRRKLMGLLL